MRTVIKDTTEQVFEPIRDAIGSILKIDASDLEIQFESPISFASEISITDIADVNELRKLIGLEERPELDDVYLHKTMNDNGSSRL